MSNGLSLSLDYNMDNKLIEQLGTELYQAWQNRVAIAPLTARHTDISVLDAYHIQQSLIKQHLNSGHKIIGKKIGVTSQVVMDMLGVYQPDFGYLLSNMLYKPAQEISISSLIQPKAEGEIAFILKKDLSGPGVEIHDVLNATEAVTACFEIVDSRIRDWQIKIQDTVADNASCGVFVLGDTLVDPYKLNLESCQMDLVKNNQLVGSGRGSAALGHPAKAVAWLANKLGELGVSLKAGEIILSGSLAAMVPVLSGDSLAVSIEGLGGCSVNFTD